MTLPSVFYAYADWPAAGRGHAVRAKSYAETLQGGLSSLSLVPLGSPEERFEPDHDSGGGVLIVDAPPESEALRAPGLDIAILDAPANTTATIRVYAGIAGHKNCEADPNAKGAAVTLSGPVFTPLRQDFTSSVRRVIEGRMQSRQTTREGYVDIRNIDGLTPLTLATKLTGAYVAIVPGGLRAMEACYAQCALVVVPDGKTETLHADELVSVGAAVKAAPEAAPVVAQALLGEPARVREMSALSSRILDGRGGERLLLVLLGYLSGLSTRVMPAPSRMVAR